MRKRKEPGEGLTGKRKWFGQNSFTYPLSVPCPKSLYEKLDEFSRVHGIPKSSLVLRALENEFALEKPFTYHIPPVVMGKKRRFDEAGRIAAR